MFTTLHRISRSHILAVLPLVLAFAACSDDPMEEEEDPAEAVVAMRLVVGNQTITVADNGTVTGGPINLTQGNTAVTASFLDAANAVVGGLDDFRLEVTSDNAAVASFARTGAFTGNLVGAAAGQTTLRFSLFHIQEQHDDFGPLPVPTVVN
ncbi:MAG: hypothetical protein L0271_23655 [Gemmatimonadetes bacterium]|nr:hypothetical protein [Gemmatimonadota bacterium]